MKQLIDFIPLIIFFVLYKMHDIYVATGALIIATAIQLVITYALYRKIEKMQLITFVMVALFGGMTIVLHNDDFIKWKVTIVYIVFAIGLAVSHVIGKSAIKGMLGKEISLPDHVWSKVTWAWVAFFSFCAGVNVYIAFKLPLDVWVNFKVFGLLAATFGFTLITGIYIYKHLPKDKSEANSGD
ncbi:MULTISPECIES: septation protein A [Vibrio]|uniref:septation protein A n=1 Tax=Vibrio TaxID=662 RepID=UPI00207627B0|nr:MULTISPECIES: septation protein A [Vibrio]USD33515.1 septation protein A [Vibrio sp. SCSIO 43186]USD46584.1 septation protein A [Vibrio sp. SCSIO 43145]USD70639.1 septation protein A [Vibrio sp. SCSIO 43139]USD95558.1 septation protein A [Vibrio coralliilyticus]